MQINRRVACGVLTCGKRFKFLMKLQISRDNFLLKNKISDQRFSYSISSRKD